MSFPTDYPKSLQKLDMLVMIGVCNSKETESVKCSGNHVDLPLIVISSNSNYTKTGSAGRSACDIDIRMSEEGKKKVELRQCGERHVCVSLPQAVQI